MDMSHNLDDLNCPQYVNFGAVLHDNSDSKSLEASPASSYSKDGEQNMDTEGENSFYNAPTQSESLQSSYSAQCLDVEDDSEQASASSLLVSPTPTVDFPVNRPNFSSSNHAAAKSRKATKVKPFNFAESKKRKREVSESAHIPMAEAVAAFHKKTPERFHTTGPKSFQPTEHWSPKRVVPKSPKLHAAKRQRRVDVMSREEQEQKEAEEIKRYRFRARPVNQSILYNRRSPSFRKRTPTKPKNAQLKTAQRAAEIHARKKSDEKPFEFHARPVPKAILNGPTGLKEKEHIPVTEAKTPNFALKSRAEKWKNDKLNETVVEAQNFKAAPLPAPSAPFAVKYEKKYPTLPQPFSFESRDKERMARKEKKIQEEIEKENSVFLFKAQPLPSPSPSLLPEVAKRPPTMPQPFNFHLEGRGSKHNSFDTRFDETGPVFKAQPATVLVKPPFIPEKAPKPPTDVKEFNLYTNARAVERQKLKEIQDIREHENELARQRQKEMQEEEERREIQKLRKDTVHKAQPIRNYKPVEITICSKPPTEPVSPKFKTDERLRSRQ